MTEGEEKLEVVPTMDELSASNQQLISESNAYNNLINSSYTVNMIFSQHLDNAANEVSPAFETHQQELIQDSQNLMNVYQ